MPQLEAFIDELCDRVVEPIEARIDAMQSGEQAQLAEIDSICKMMANELKSRLSGYVF